MYLSLSMKCTGSSTDRLSRFYSSLLSCRRILSSSVKLFSYLAHSSGANTLSLIQTNTHDSPPTSTDTSTPPLGGEGEYADLGCVWNVIIASGGDDQAISVCSASISIEMSGERKSGTVDSEVSATSSSVLPLTS